MIHCVFNQIPLLICGKPGCSKTLSVQILIQNFKGRQSKDPYFRILPELIQVSYQGSQTSTSEGIQKVFDRAEKYLDNKSISILPVITFDEIGLAEISKHNPLKTLHSLLELEKCKVGFVGISNWRLDASKMNRALYLARPDPTQDDLTYTAVDIYMSQSNKDSKYRDIIIAIAESYFDLKGYLKQFDMEEFYGLRDFYTLIKQVSISLILEDALDIGKNIKYHIYRNFSGKFNACQRMITYLLSKDIQQKYKNQIQEADTPLDSLTLIKDNLQEKSSRYLLLITKGSFAQKILTYENVINLVGSNFADDILSDEYGIRILNNIKFYCEQGMKITLKNFNNIYSSLYDLFNQNFINYSSVKECRISLGAYFNRHPVHDDFKVIVFLNDDEETIQKTDPPFLNRFEKHQVNIQDFFDQQMIEVYQQLDS